MDHVHFKKECKDRLLFDIEKTKRIILFVHEGLVTY